MGKIQRHHQLQQKSLSLLLYGVIQGGLLAVCTGCRSGSAFSQLLVGFFLRSVPHRQLGIYV